MTEAANATHTIDKFLNNFKSGSHDRYEYHLRNPFPRLDNKSVLATIPARDIQLPLVIRVDEADQIAQHYAMLVTET